MIIDGAAQRAAYAPLAHEVLDAFDRIAGTARGRLNEERGGPLDAFASVNAATAEKLMKNAVAIRDSHKLDWRRLTSEPAIARLVVVDEDDRKETFYVSRGGTVDPTGVQLCSYLSPKGALASLPVGEGRELALPGGRRWFHLVERATFSPVPDELWDARPAIVHDAQGRPKTIRSLRALLRDDGFRETLDTYERYIGSEDVGANVFEGLQRGIQTAMELRVNALLDAAQSDIFRLPVSTRLVLLGPAGTGKTTTLIKRLRQKIDWRHLDEDEQRSIGEEHAVAHATSWIVFTPTDLLKRYVQEAISKEDVPAPESRLRTWFDYRRELARRHLPILRSGSGSGFGMKDGLGVLAPAAVQESIAWYEAFDAFQRASFVDGLAGAAEQLAASLESSMSALGRRAGDMVARHRDRPLPLLTELASLFDALQEEVAKLRDATRGTLRQPLILHFRRNRDALDALARFVATLSPDIEESGEDAEVYGDDEEEEDAVPLGDRTAAEAAFVRALRARAIAQAGRRALPQQTRAARILAWAAERGIELPPLGEIGEGLLIQRAAARLLRAPNLYLRRMGARYRQFRRNAQPDGRWYLANGVNANDADPLEIDLIILGVLRGALTMRRDAVLMRRMGDRAPPLIETVHGLTRHQVLVDEATDFSPVQLACMAQLARPGLDSFCASGDFNQRVTAWGSRSPGELGWLYPDLRVEHVNIAYRQSRRLTEFALGLVSDRDSTPAQMPEFIENEGVSPVLGTELGEPGTLAKWRAARIREVERFSGTLPTIAVLVNAKADLDPLARALNAELEDDNIRAVACPDGQAIGPENDVRLFEAEHIKGLQFEAVFFTDVDRLAAREPDLFDKYLYVGATRAATYLGLTCTGQRLPTQLSPLEPLLGTNWQV